jgi:hypothetical protein
MTEDKTQGNNQASPLTQHIALLNLRINDMMAQLYTVTKMAMDENATLRKENAEIKAKVGNVSKS